MFYLHRTTHADNITLKICLGLTNFCEVLHAVCPIAQMSDGFQKQTSDHTVFNYIKRVFIPSCENILSIYFTPTDLPNKKMYTQENILFFQNMFKIYQGIIKFLKPPHVRMLNKFSLKLVPFVQIPAAESVPVFYSFSKKSGIISHFLSSSHAFYPCKQQTSHPCLKSFSFIVPPIHVSVSQKSPSKEENPKANCSSFGNLPALAQAQCSKGNCAPVPSVHPTQEWKGSPWELSGSNCSVLCSVKGFALQSKQLLTVTLGAGVLTSWTCGLTFSFLQLLFPNFSRRCLL